MANKVVWFDIPATNIDRAIAFYSKVLKIEIQKVPDTKMGVLDHGRNDVAGCIYEDNDLKPSQQGPLLYFNVNERLNDAIKNVESCGGKILQAKHAIGPHGFRAVVLDSEGNRIALHSEKDC